MQIGSFSASSGQFSGSSALGVDQSTGDVYVLDGENNRVEKFDPEGHLITSFGDSTPPNGELKGLDTPAGSFSFSFNAVAVDNSGGPNAGDLYVSDRGHEVIDVFSSSGNYLRQITGIEALGIAVDASGNLWAAGLFSREITEFDPSGTLISSFGTSEFNIGLAVDSTDQVYSVESFCGCEIYRYNSDGSDATRIDGSSAFGPAPLAIDESTNDVYVAGGTQVFEYDEEGNSIGSFGSGALSEANAVALDYAGPPADRGYIYVTDAASHEVKVFAPVVAPSATTGPASNPQRNSAELTGSVNPNGEPLTDCHFEYVAASEYNPSALNPYSSGESIPCSQSLESIGSGTGEVPVSAEPTDLQAQTTYHFRLVAGNPNGLGGREVTGSGQDETTTTIPAVASTNTGPATNVEVSTATLTGSFEPQGLDTHYYFQYGNDTSYGHNSAVPPGTDAGSGNGVQNVSMEVTDLAPDTTYHFRIVASNSTGITYGQDETFTTHQPPSIDAFSTSGVTATSALLNAKINPNGAPTTYHFEYGPTTAYGTSVPEPGAALPASTSVEAVQAELTGLQPHTIYHFRVVAESIYGTMTTEDQTFQFYPGACPNEALRQQTGASFLPDCRAYELVSPGNMGNFVLFGSSDRISSPVADNRFAYVGGLGAIPGTGVPENSIYVDTYVATRTNEGWVTKHVGVPGNESDRGEVAAADLNLDKFIAYKNAEEPNPPLLYDASGNFLGAWPTVAGYSLGATQWSADFSHFFFTEGEVAYDNNTVANTVTSISQDEAGNPVDVDTLPGASSDGSHILMSTYSSPPECNFYGCTYSPARLYVRVGDAVTYEVSQGHYVRYVGMTSYGSKVFFTSEEQLTPEDARQQYGPLHVERGNQLHHAYLESQQRSRQHGNLQRVMDRKVRCSAGHRRGWERQLDLCGKR